MGTGWPGVEGAWPWIAAALFGWVWGSFLNQLIDRAPPRGGAAVPVPPGVTTGERPADWPGLLRPRRSFCFSCGVGLPWYDNLPVLSWLLLRGRCRRCGASIGVRTLLVEIATPLGFVALMASRGGPQAGWGVLWDFALLSWGLAGCGRAVERRRLGLGMLALGCGIALGWLLRPGGY